jgi:DNA invertase Pin-like site-specific DNA recombinase
MKPPPLACAIYTRKSSEEGLEQSFNSLDAQREACAAFILSQKAQGWHALPRPYDDGGYSGGNVERPALQRLLADVSAQRIRVIVVYKVDRLTRSLADFAKLVELFDRHEVSFVSVTQQFNTTSSMGRLTLNVLLSFAQFEREVTGERIRDKIAASKRKGLWMGGTPPIGYLARERTLIADEPRAEQIRAIYRLYLALKCVRKLREEVQRRGWVTAPRQTRKGSAAGSRPFSRGHLHRILCNPIYRGQIAHRGVVHSGQHPPIVDEATWQAVQAQLATNRQGQRERTRCRDPALLAGLIFDAEGRRLTPTHAKKGSRRYRYYVSQSLIQGDAASKAGLRIPARELEGAVVRGLMGLLTDSSGLLPLMQQVTPAAVEAMLRRAAEINHQLRVTCRATDADAPRSTKGDALALSSGGSNTPSAIALLHRLVMRISVTPTRLEIVVRLDPLIREDGRAPDDPDGRSREQRPRTTVLSLPIELKRCGLGMRLIVNAAGVARQYGPDPRLIALLAKANRWFLRLTSEPGIGVLDIAGTENVTSSYVVRVIYLAFLAPDIALAISRGEYPPALTAKQLLRSAPLPRAWSEQRQRLAFTEKDPDQARGIVFARSSPDRD